MASIKKKYEFTGRKKGGLRRIKALRGFGDVKKGELGGWLEKKNNLSQEGDAWVGGNARVFENARVFGDAQVSDDACMYGNAKVYGDAEVYKSATVYANAEVYEFAEVMGEARVFGHAKVSGYVIICGSAYVHGTAQISGSVSVYGNAVVCGNSKVSSSQGILYLQTTSFDATLTRQGIVIGCHRKTYKEWLKSRHKEFKQEISREDYKALRTSIIALWQAWFENPKPKKGR